MQNPFHVRIYVRASVEEVRKSWLRCDCLETWFLARCTAQDPAGHRVEELSSGTASEWTWFDGSSEVIRVLETRPDRLRFSWFGDDGLVEVRFSRAGQETLVELEQRMLVGTPEKIADYQWGCHEGWTFFLANLKSVLEGGIDLRERDAQRKGVLNM